MTEYEDVVSDAIRGINEHVGGGTKTFFVSELPFCIRKVMFGRKFKYKAPPSASMTQGTIFHNSLPDIIKEINKRTDYKYYGGREAKIVYEVECRRYLQDDLLLMGHADVMFQGEDGKSLVEEWKYSGSNLNHGPVPAYYLAQTNMYSTMLKCDSWRINVVNKNTHKMVSFEGTPIKELFEKMAGRAKTCYDILNNRDSSINKIDDRMSYEGFKTLANIGGNTELLEELAEKMPLGPEESFECSSRTGDCAYKFICDHGKFKED